jgi:hypothetical protein
MKEKDRGNLIELCKIQMDHFEKTRNIEFKVNIALWTLIVLSGKFLYDKGIPINESFWRIGGVIIFLHLWWMISVQHSEGKDLRFIYQCRQKLLEAVGFTPKGFIPDKNKWSILGSLSWIFLEVGITILLLVGLAIVLSIKP